MAWDHVSLELEGDFLSSFIYSGVLLLVDSDFVLSAYSWQEVLSAAVRGGKSAEQISLPTYLNNSTNGTMPTHCRNKVFGINKRALGDLDKRQVSIHVWPSDINVYKNRVYVSSDNGVNIIDFKWDNGKIESFSEPKNIWTEAAFSISPNNFYRLAIAAGKNGVLSYVPKNIYIRDDEIFQIVESVCVDCDWQNERLVANTVDGVDLIDYQAIPNKTDFKGAESEYWSIVNTIKRTPPEIKKLPTVDGEKIISGWLAGNKLFYLTDTFEIGFTNHEFNADIANQHTPRKRKIDNNSGNVLSSRTASFGTVVEFSDRILVLGRDTSNEIIDDFSAWRVFPRSKNYTNHLHLIKDDRLTISVLEASSAEGVEDGFGFSVGDVSGETWL